MSDALELAWAAGLFDGEGWVTHNKTLTLSIGIGQSGDSEVLDRFALAVGIGNINGPYDYGYKPRYQWSACGNKARAVLQQLEPYLSSIKLRRWKELEEVVIHKLSEYPEREQVNQRGVRP